MASREILTSTSIDEAPPEIEVTPGEEMSTIGVQADLPQLTSALINLAIAAISQIE